ncbi:MAG: hypothetical protein R3E88_15250 [Myxococcota bacterium]|nr:hypothetical protein [Myxococcales bacterium]
MATTRGGLGRIGRVWVGPLLWLALLAAVAATQARGDSPARDVADSVSVATCEAPLLHAPAPELLAR